MSRAILIIIVATWVGCAPTNTGRIDIRDVALRLNEQAEPALAEAVLDARPPAETELVYNNLCVRKECEPRAVHYTQLFRSAAVLSLTLRTLDSMLKDADAGAVEQEVFEIAQFRLERWNRELDALESELDGLSVATDFEDERARARAESGRQKALLQIRSVRSVSSAVGGQLRARVGEVEFDVQWPERAAVDPPRGDVTPERVPGPADPCANTPSTTPVQLPVESFSSL